MDSPPRVVAFDVNETLFSLGALAERFADEGLPAESVPTWFARVLRDGFALAVTGDYADFLDLARHHLGALLREADRDGTPEQVGNVLAAFKELRPHPDVEAAFARLRDAGVRIVTLTNGSADTTNDLLARADLGGYVERCLSVEAPRLWKPRPEPYYHAAQVCEVEPGEMSLIAVHSWDTHGAQRAGLVGAWCSRLEGTFAAGFAEPDVRGDDLVEVVDRLLER